MPYQIEAYQRLKALKKPGESFTEVIEPDDSEQGNPRAVRYSLETRSLTGC